MLQTKLTTRTKVQVYKQVSISVTQEVFDSILIQCQLEDIAPLLGENLFNDLVTAFDGFRDKGFQKLGFHGLAPFALGLVKEVGHPLRFHF